jgi:dCTP deaminase
MTIKADHWIRRMAATGMIEPFEPGQVRSVEGRRIVSYGTSSYGYDVRCANEFKIFTNINSTIVDPKAFDPASFVDVTADIAIIPPNSFALARTVEYFRIPRNVLTICLGKSTYARCFRGDTKVALVDGTAPTLEEMARRAGSGEVFFGYSIDANGRMIVSLLDSPRFIGRDILLEVELDDGARIHTTPDHLFMTRDGRMVSAGDLRPADSLMPLYRHRYRGYEMAYQPLNGHVLPTHRLADEWNLRHGIYEDAPGTHRHHLDFDRRNNRPTNLVRMPATEHIRLDDDESYSGDFDPAEHSAAIRHALERRMHEPAWRERYSALPSDRASASWSDDRCADARQRLPELRRHVTDEPRARHRAATVRRARATAGSIRGAARVLGCDRSVVRQFPDVVARAAGRACRNHKVASVRPLPGVHDVYCLTVPEAGNFALQAGVFVHNCGIIVNVTPLEPEWEGHVTLEFSNTTTLPAKIYANEGVAQMLFFESDEVCGTSYKDRGGKYMGQRGVTLPKT